MIPSLALPPVQGLAIATFVGVAAQALFGTPAGDRWTLFALRSLHWTVSVLGMSYPFVFGPSCDIAFVVAWVFVLASWAFFDNSCVLTLAEMTRMETREKTTEMHEIPWPWPGFVVLLLVVALRLPSVKWCPDKVMLMGALATYVAVHATIVASARKRWTQIASPHANHVHNQ